MATSKPKNLSPIDFETLEPIEVPVRIKGTDYILREASEAAAIQLRAAGSKGMVLDPETQKVTVNVGDSSAHEANALIVSLCLCQTINGKIKLDTSGNPVTVDLRVVKQWPPRVVNTLAERAVEISEGLLPTKNAKDSLESFQAKRFPELVEEGLGFSESEADKEQWVEWMTRVIREKAEKTPTDGRSLEDPGKNSPNGGPATSASPTSLAKA